jgi:hypothetical protein
VHTDAYGYLDQRRSGVVVDGKMVSYRGGKIIITSAPEKAWCGPSVTRQTCLC